MATAVRFTVLTGPHKDCRFCFCGPNRCQIGRAMDCFMRLAGTERDQLISRHHCQLEVNPPAIQVLDLGSRNGTYVNGRKVETYVQESVQEAAFAVEDGDLITVGGTTLVAEIIECPHAVNEAGHSAWREGVTAKRDCPLTC